MGQQTLTALGIKFLHYIRSKFFTIVFGMMLVAYTPIFRHRKGVSKNLKVENLKISRFCVENNGFFSPCSKCVKMFDLSENV